MRTRPLRSAPCAPRARAARRSWSSAFVAPRLAGAPALRRRRARRSRCWPLAVAGRCVGPRSPPSASCGKARRSTSASRSLAVLLVRWAPDARGARDRGLRGRRRRWSCSSLAALAAPPGAPPPSAVLLPGRAVHALFAWQLARQGSSRFLAHFTENQFRYSLGLQIENGHWYAFPYPPAFYMLCWPLVTLCAVCARRSRSRSWRRRSTASRCSSSSGSRGGCGARRVDRARGRGGAGRCCRSSSSACRLAYFPALVGPRRGRARDPRPPRTPARAGSTARRLDPGRASSRSRC